MQPQKRPGPAPTGKGTPIQVRMQATELGALDAWRRDQPDLPTRPEAIRRLVEAALSGRAAPSGSGDTDEGGKSARRQAQRTTGVASSFGKAGSK